MQQVKKYLGEYSFVFIWIICGLINTYLGAGVTLITFLLMLKKEEYIKVLLGLLILLIISDNAYRFLRFATTIKPVIILLLGVYSLFATSKLKLKNYFFWPFGLFFIYILSFSLFTSVGLINFQKSLSYALTFFTIPTLIILIKKRGELKNLFIHILYLGNFILIISITLGLFFPSVGAQYQGRLNGVFRNPNGFGTYLILYSMLSYTVSSYIKPSIRRNQATIILIILALFFCSSRTAFGALLIFIIGVTMAKKSPWIFSVFTIIFILMNQFIFDLILSLIASTGFSETFRVDSIVEASGRIFVWQAAWQEILDDKFFFGGGFTFSENLQWIDKYKQTIHGLYEHQGNVHQSFLSLWLNTGIIGLALYSMAWLKAIFFSLKKSTLTLPVTAAIIFSASYESWLIGSLNPYTIQVLIIFSIILFYDKDELDFNNKVTSPELEQKLPIN